MSSFNESVALGCLKQAPIEFVKYPLLAAHCQLVELIVYTQFYILILVLLKYYLIDTTDV